MLSATTKERGKKSGYDFVGECSVGVSCVRQRGTIDHTVGGGQQHLSPPWMLMKPTASSAPDHYCYPWLSIITLISQTNLTRLIGNQTRIQSLHIAVHWVSNILRVAGLQFLINYSGLSQVAWRRGAEGSCWLQCWRFDSDKLTAAAHYIMVPE